MCLGGGGVARTQVAEREYQNRPVTVTGTQIGVDNPKDTKKATEELKIQRQKKEGTYVDPNLTTARKLTRSGYLVATLRKPQGCGSSWGFLYGNLCYIVY